MKLKTPEPSDRTLDDILKQFRSSTITIHAIGSVRGAEEDARAFKSSFEQAKSEIEAWAEAGKLEARKAEATKACTFWEMNADKPATYLLDRLAELEAERRKLEGA